MPNMFTRGMFTELLGKLYIALQYTGGINPECRGPALSLPIVVLGNEVTSDVEGNISS